MAGKLERRQRRVRAQATLAERGDDSLAVLVVLLRNGLLVSTEEL